MHSYMDVDIHIHAPPKHHAATATNTRTRAAAHRRWPRIGAARGAEAAATSWVTTLATNGTVAATNNDKHVCFIRAYLFVFWNYIVYRCLIEHI